MAAGQQKGEPSLLGGWGPGGLCGRNWVCERLGLWALFGESETGSECSVVEGAVGDLPGSFSSSDHRSSFENRA